MINWHHLLDSDVALAVPLEESHHVGSVESTNALSIPIIAPPPELAKFTSPLEVAE